MGFMVEELLLGDMPWWAWGLLALACMVLWAMVNLPSGQRQKWSEAHAEVRDELKSDFAFFQSRYLSRTGIIRMLYHLPMYLLLLLLMILIARAGDGAEQAEDDPAGAIIELPEDSAVTREH